MTMHLDNFNIGRQIGTGGFSKVLEASYRKGKKCALKIYNLPILNTVELQAIDQEIEILRRVESTSIIKLFSHFEDMFENTPSKILVMEYMSGGDLFDRIASMGIYDESHAQEACRQILEAVAHCHFLFIAHRDLKPENILLSGNEDGSEIIKLADFGFATFASSNDALKTQCGTLTYVAPEILLGTRYGRQVDIWSVGVIAYILLLGYPPFADQQPNIARRIVENRYHRIADQGWSQLSELSKDFLAKLLVQDPSERLTADQALQHPWLTNSIDEMQMDNLNPNYLERLRIFNSKRKLRAAVYTVVLTNKLTSLGIFLNSTMAIVKEEK